MKSNNYSDEIEEDLKILLDAGVDVRIEGNGCFIIDAKNLDKIDKFREQRKAISDLFNGKEML